MYPVNKPNKYNAPKETPPFFLKEGRWFWMSKLMGTYTPENEKVFRENLTNRLKEEQNVNVD